MSVDAGNHLLARPLPRRIGVRIADVRDVFVCAEWVRFRDALDFAICHLPLLLALTTGQLHWPRFSQLPFSRSEILA